MLLIARNPLDQITVLNFDLLSAYRLMLTGQDEYLGVGIKYPLGAGFSTLLVGAITIPGIPDANFKAIEAHGLGTGDITKDIERLKDAMRSLYNAAAKTQVVDEAIEKAKDIVEFYWWLKPFVMQSGDVSAEHTRSLGAWWAKVKV